MPERNPGSVSVAPAAAGVMAGASGAAQKKMVDELVRKIKEGSDTVRTETWLGAWKVAAPGLRPLATVMAEKDMEVARAAKRGLWQIVRHAGRPGAKDQKEAVIDELIALLGENEPAVVRREVLWMLSEIGGDESVEAIVSVLLNKELREDARMALERIPGKKSIEALKTALKSVPGDFRLNIAQSLRRRGVSVRGLRCVKLVPTEKTNIKPMK